MKRTSLIKPVLDGVYPMISHGKGIYLYDTDGKEYLDGSSGAVTANIGHGVEEIRVAMDGQANKVSFVYRSQFTSEAAEGLATKIAEMTNGTYPWSFFVNSGSEATETALKIAVQHWQEKGKPKKNRVISRWMSYHGITLGALSMSGHPQRRERFTAMLESYPSISAPYCYRCPYNLELQECGFACAAELESAIRRTGPENVAAFIAEPVIGAAGAAISPPDGYFQELKRICEKYDVLFIADEVMTGFGRTGQILACSHWGVEPDIIAFGKGMSGGYTPIGAAVMTEKVIEPILKGSKSIMAGHTLSANPLSCAVSLAVLEYVEKNGLDKNASRSGIYLRNLLEKLSFRYPFIGNIRGKGLLIGIEFVKDIETKEPFPEEFDVTGKMISLAAENGLLLYPAAAGPEGVGGAAIIISPPLTITKREIEELIRRLNNTLYQFKEAISQDT
ncbi:aspartate aminotransferase family protein [Peribacillus glennii]|uniref:Aspartate aminotransferase family protein n=1 Tax=Peribacillus glennii TaxID=2303991 RepID=A0A372LGL4_9BACI|nr:aspartate aminotransferase family protein [Peribacillus glennii]RFU65441.1 aspartate aminotransferase family protein [Peribacillus glennii]